MKYDRHIGWFKYLFVKNNFGLYFEMNEWRGIELRNFNIVANGTSRKSLGEFMGPKTVSVEPYSQNIYVSDMLNHRVQVFSPSFEFLFVFPYSQGIYMRYPWDVCIHSNLVFVTESRDCYLIVNPSYYAISMYTLDGTFVSRIRQFGITLSDKRPNMPRRIAVDDERNVYITDYRKNRVLLHCTGLPTVATVVCNIHSPIDVKVHGGSLFVLSKEGILNETSLHGYETKRIIEKGMLDENWKPKYFEIRDGTIYITLFMSDNVYKFSLNGDLIFRSNIKLFVNSTGIMFDRVSQIVKICEKYSGRF